MDHFELDKQSSMLNWYPKIQGDLPTPKTVILELTDADIRDLYNLLSGDPPSPSLLPRIQKAAQSIGYPLFLRTDLFSGKHEWTNTCYVDSARALKSNIPALVEANECAGIIGPPIRALVFREYRPLYSHFKAFRGMPVAREQRYFVEAGRILCRHPYWPEDAIEKAHHFQPLPSSWRDALSDLNRTDATDDGMLAHFAAKFAELMPGYWSVDFAFTEVGQWLLIDAARGEASWHPDCIHNKTPPPPTAVVDEDPFEDI